MGVGGRGERDSPVWGFAPGKAGAKETDFSSLHNITYGTHDHRSCNADNESSLGFTVSWRAGQRQQRLLLHTDFWLGIERNEDRSESGRHGSTRR